MDPGRCEPKGTDPSQESRGDLSPTSERAQHTIHFRDIDLGTDEEFLRQYIPHNTIPSKHTLFGPESDQVDMSWL